MNDKKRYEAFCEAWEDLDNETKIRVFNQYAMEHNPDDQLYVFDEDFFNTFYANNPMDAVRACFFGNIKSWSDEYIRFNGYANLVSMSEYEAAEWADDYRDSIYEHEECWCDDIEIDDDDEDEDDDEDAYCEHGDALQSC